MGNRDSSNIPESSGEGLIFDQREKRRAYAFPPVPRKDVQVVEKHAAVLIAELQFGDIRSGVIFNQNPGEIGLGQARISDRQGVSGSVAIIEFCGHTQGQRAGDPKAIGVFSSLHLKLDFARRSFH